MGLTLSPGHDGWCPAVHGFVHGLLYRIDYLIVVPGYMRQFSYGNHTIIVSGVTVLENIDDIAYFGRSMRVGGTDGYVCRINAPFFPDSVQYVAGHVVRQAHQIQRDKNCWILGIVPQNHRFSFQTMDDVDRF